MKAVPYADFQLISISWFHEEGTVMTIETINSSYKPAGRVVLRKVGGGETALVGIFHFEPAFKIVEGASYLLHLQESGVSVYSNVVDPEVPADLAAFDIGYHLTAPIWRKPAVDGVLVVRFILQWPATNSWLVYGCAPASPVSDDKYSATGHLWLEQDANGLRSIVAPAEGMGLTMAQMASDLLVWPDAQGVFHTLCCIPTNWRADYLAYNKLQVSLGRGHITRFEFKSHIYNDDRLFFLQTNPNEDYLRYLVRLDDLGGIQEAAPYSEVQLRERSERCEEAIRCALLV